MELEAILAWTNSGSSRYHACGFDLEEKASRFCWTIYHILFTPVDKWAVAHDIRFLLHSSFVITTKTVLEDASAFTTSEKRRKLMMPSHRGQIQDFADSRPLPITAGTCGVRLNINAVSVVIQTEIWWNANVEWQVICHSHRQFETHEASIRFPYPP